MSNIDTNNCKFKDKFYGTCEATRDKGGECELACFDCKDCYYRQIQQLKAENEELKEFKKLLIEQLNFNTSELELRLSAETQRSEFLLKEFKKADKVRDEFIDKYLKSLKILDEIMEIAKNGVKDDCGMPLDELSIILNIIKQAKEGGE